MLHHTAGAEQHFLGPLSVNHYIYTSETRLSHTFNWIFLLLLAKGSDIIPYIFRIGSFIVFLLRRCEDTVVAKPA